LVSHGICAHGQQGSAAPAEQRRGDIEIQPLLTRYCQDCHSQDLAEADIDLSSFRNLDDVRTRLVVWEKVRAMLNGDQMPPPEAPQPTSAEKTQMREWVHRVLAGFAREQAGDP